jgi:Domain of unknown function (DUF6473)
VAETGGYPALDRHIVDYEVFDLPPLSGLRGPKPPLDPGRFFVCIGAAQTYGRFCQRAFPAILSEELSLPALNLGAAGAGPLLFLRRPELFEYINRARFAVVQVMSARGEDNSYFESLDFGILRRRSGGDPMLTWPAYQELLETESEEVVRQIVAETRSNFVRYYADLLARIDVPTVLFWFARRTPEYSEGYSDVRQLFGGFPQLVDAATVAQLRPHVGQYVECVTSRGLPQPLFDRFTGERTTMQNTTTELGGRQLTHNFYYPSPEMHEDAAAALREPARSILKRSSVAAREA